MFTVCFLRSPADYDICNIFHSSETPYERFEYKKKGRKIQRFLLSFDYFYKPSAVTEPQLKSCQNVGHQMRLKNCMIDCSFSRANPFRLDRFITFYTAAAVGFYFSLSFLKGFFVCTINFFLNSINL